MIRFMEPYRSMYDKSQDEFQHWLFIVLPCAGVTLLTIAVNGDSDWMDVLWNFSIYLESVAILPQLWALRRYREVENLTGHYIFFLGAYRFFYILNWVWRSYNEEYATRRASRLSFSRATSLRPLPPKVLPPQLHRVRRRRAPERALRRLRVLLHHRQGAAPRARAESERRRARSRAAPCAPAPPLQYYGMPVTLPESES